MDKISLIFDTKHKEVIHVRLKRGRVIADELSLTISQDFDTLLIVTIDKLVERNRIDRLRIKSLDIPGKLRPGAVSSLILQTVKIALKV